jgi:hypothetical protein
MGRIILIDKTLRVVGMRVGRRYMMGVRDVTMEMIQVRKGEVVESMGIMG